MTDQHPSSLVATQTYSLAGTFLRAPHAATAIGADVAVMGIPLDITTTNRPGARFGPGAIRQATAQLAELKAYPSGLDPVSDLSIVDLGDVMLEFGRPGTIVDAITAAARSAADAGAYVLSLGGDHFVTYPLIRAQAERLGRPIALLQFDAHPDTWEESPGDGPELNHGTMLWRAIREGYVDVEHSIQIGIRTFVDDPLGVEQIDAQSSHTLGIDGVSERILQRLADQPYYLTIDIDALDPAFAPGTGTPVMGGMAGWQLQAILRKVLAARMPISGDVVEVAPAYDQAEITALAGATLAFEQVVALAAAKRASAA